MGFGERLLGARSVVSGALLYTAMRWFDRALGVISTIVLARLLVPDDFGVVALATIALGFLLMMFDVGLNVRLVQMGEIDRTDIDTAWTIRLVRNLFLAALLAFGAPAISDYFGDSRLTPVMRWMALGIAIGGLNSMAPVLFQRRREFAREVAYVMSQRFVGFGVTIALAFWLRNYWSMVYGSFAAGVFACAMSYWMMPELRRPTLRNWRRFLGASVWLTLRSLGQYASEQVDKVFLGRIAGPASLGAYSIASQIGAMPSTELLQPMNRALFPAYSQISNDPARIGPAVHLTFGIQTMIALPASLGLALCSAEIVHVFLGEKWLDAAPLLAMLAVAYGFASLNSSFIYFLLSLGKFRLQAALSWANFLVMAGILLVLSATLDAITVANVRVAVAGLSSLLLLVAALSVRSGVTARGCLKSSWRQVAACLVMVGSVVIVGMTLESLADWLLLMIKMAVGIVSYTCALLMLWQLAGRPEGAERWALSTIRKAREGWR